MLKSTITFSILSISLFTLSCQSAAEKKWEQTMKVHDVVMLKMQETGEMAQKIDALLQKSKTADSTSILFVKQDTLVGAIHQLEKADIEMMNWMANIQKPTKSDDQDSILHYLDQEEKAIVTVGNQMDQAIHHAEGVISSLKK